MDTKVWIAASTIEVTATVTEKQIVNLDDKKNNIMVLEKKIKELEEDVSVKKKALEEARKELAELEAVPNRPKEVEVSEEVKLEESKVVEPVKK